ncbi:MAG: hypothetical protein QMC37_09625, partial [Flavobacteriales bacterium]
FILHMQKEHECGFECPFVIQCEGAFVCTKTGKCFGQLYDISRDGVSNVLQKGSIKGSAIIKKEKGARDASHVNNVSADDSVHERHIAECIGIMRKIVGAKKKINTHTTVCKHAIKNAMQYLKSNGHSNIVQAVAHAEREYQTRNMRVKAENDEEMYRRIALRCLRCFKLSTVNQPGKNPKREYVFLACLYLLRDGLNVNEVTFVQKESFLNDILPNLHVLNDYGYDKGKYTKAETFLKTFFKNAVGKIPLHDMQI